MYLSLATADPRIQRYHPPRRLTFKQARALRTSLDRITTTALRCSVEFGDNPHSVDRTKATAEHDLVLEYELGRADALGYRRQLLVAALARLPGLNGEPGMSVGGGYEYGIEA